MFLPATKEELRHLGWKSLDIILISGDAYIDSPHIGIAVIGRVLANAGYRVGVIAQPDIHSDKDIARLGEPELFWGVSSGCVDSMISNYTASRKPRRQDDLTPGGANTKRPDRAVIVYANLIRRYFKQTKPIVLGGIEASLRRISHYDFWSDSIKRSILFDAKADALVYGMGEKTVLELARSLKENQDIRDIRGLCYAAKEKQGDGIELPSHHEVSEDKDAFTRMFQIFYENADPVTVKRLYQKQDTRYLVQNPPQFQMEEKDLDDIYDLPFERDVHPYCKQQGAVKALETIRFSITTHRGCFGECRFCAIAVHQGRRITNRSENSVLKEARLLTELSDFKGYISDIGGPTANMYGMDCDKQKNKGVCKDKHCISCKNMRISHQRQIGLLKNLRNIPGIKKVFIGSGIRYDLVLNDSKYGREYLEDVVKHHISGQMKIAPEHSEDKILQLMGKPGSDMLKKFKAMFDRLNAAIGKKQFLTYYFIAAHPGCEIEDMQKLKSFIKKELRLKPEQAQIFTPSPSTWSTLMYYTQKNPFTGEKLFVEKELRKKEQQKAIVV